MRPRARVAAEEALVEQALEAGILQTARDNAEVILTGFLRSLGYSEVVVVQGVQGGV